MATRKDKVKAEQPTMTFVSQSAWEQWLDANHAICDGIWLKYAKKASGIASVAYAEALEVALCYGWIDGQVKSIDATWYMQRYTPRRSRSKWSKVNCKKVAVLIDQGKMKSAGLRQIEAAKADGRWDAAYDSPRTATMPEDFARALKKNRKAAAFFETVKGNMRYAIYYRIQDARKPQTRERRINQYIEMLAAGKKMTW